MALYCGGGPSAWVRLAVRMKSSQDDTQRRPRKNTQNHGQRQTHILSAAHSFSLPMLDSHEGNKFGSYFNLSIVLVKTTDIPPVKTTNIHPTTGALYCELNV